MLGRSRDCDRTVPIAGALSLGRGDLNFGASPAEPPWLPAAVVLFLALGCGFRIIRSAQNLPLWSDECFLAVNFIRRGYWELLQPLDNGQIAPLLFLWIQRFTIDLVGFSEWGL